MELKIFFDRVEEQLYENISDTGVVLQNIFIHNNSFPEWRNCPIAIIGLIESRGNSANTGADKAANEIRKSFYSLKKGIKSIKIADLGNLRNGETLIDTYERLKEVCGTLIENNIFVILIGGTHDLDLGQYQAYEKTDKLVTIVSVDAIADLHNERGYGNSSSHLHDIITYEPNYLFHLCHLGHQSFLNDNQAFEALEKLHFEMVRLGVVKESVAEAEPLIRQGDMLTFDVGAIKRADAPGNNLSNVFGLTAEEACQITWYAGLNDKLTSAGIFEYNPDKDQENQTAFVIATMLWYMVEGFTNRQGDLNFDENRFMRYMVSTGKSADQVLVFYKSKFSEKWWMEIPQAGNKQHDKNRMVPCSYLDYQTALNGELPNRWLLMHGKLF
ncbi:MAG: formimidoylglutamase [Opitutaceae bacterium]|nr:formimidoylglutamase [Cytophagales bacterium]